MHSSCCFVTLAIKTTDLLRYFTIAIYRPFLKGPGTDVSTWKETTAVFTMSPGIATRVVSGATFISLAGLLMFLGLTTTR